jgi:hypothetical protein
MITTTACSLRAVPTTKYHRCPGFPDGGTCQRRKLRRKCMQATTNEMVSALREISTKLDNIEEKISVSNTFQSISVNVKTGKMNAKSSV